MSATTQGLRKSYPELLKDPRWQKKRLEIFNRDQFACCHCTDTELTLHVHHKKYIPGHKPWEYEDDNFKTLCAICHELEHLDMTETERQLLKWMWEADRKLEIVKGLRVKSRDLIYQQIKNR